MKTRIIKIKGCKTCKELLIFKDRDHNGEEFVQLVAWHKFEGGDFIQKAQVDYSQGGIADSVMNERIINDFTEESALAFVNTMSF